MNTDLHLDSLLNALRAAGLRVGISEVLRLRQVFAGEPPLTGGEVSRHRLRALLRAVLLKSAEDRGTFDRICDAWLDRAEEEIALRRVRERPLPIPLPVRRRRRWRSVLGQGTMAAALVGLLLLVDRDMRVSPLPPSPPDPLSQPHSQPPGEGEPPPIVTPDHVRKRSIRATVATLEVTARPWHFLLRPEMGLAAFVWLGAGGLWLALRRRRLLPEPPPLLPATGPPRAFPLPVVSASAVLLDPRDQDALVWGIGRFVSDEPTRRLDLAATVRATALAGGLPGMRFHRARFYREVWLWLDEDAADPALPRLAAEIERVLASHGLPVERATFRGIPSRLVTPAGQVFAPNEIDERRDVALVAVLTDGRRLVRRWRADDQRVRIDALLRSLSHWPHLAFVDASRDREGLAAILGRHGLAVIPPENAAAFLGGAVPRKVRHEAGGAERAGEAAWAAACALCPSPVDESTALELRRQLGLAISPFALQALRAEAPGPPGRLAWKAADRVRRVRWLRQAEAHPPEGVAPRSLLDRALEFWKAVYDRSLEKATGSSGDETAAGRFLRMERALLGLWRQPSEPIAVLYQLFQGPLREEIGRHLAVLAPAGWGGPGLIQLPWPWSRPEPVERAMLRTMGLGGDMPPVGLRRPGRTWLGIGLLAGLGLAAGGAAFRGHSAAPPEIVEAGTPPAGGIIERTRLGTGGWRVTVGSPREVTSAPADAGGRVLVRWQPRTLRCAEPGTGGEEVWRCGRSAVPGPRLEGVSRSVVYLDRSLGRAATEELALDLIDSGSADVVIIGRYPGTSIPGPIEAQQTLLLTSFELPDVGVINLPSLGRGTWLQVNRLAGIESLLRFEGTRRVREVVPASKVASGDPSRVLLRGLGTGCTNSQIEEDGFTFVRICPGTFTMGFVDEAHRVTLNEFWLSQFETTNEQYRIQPDHEGEANLPVTGVGWNDARDFCTKLGHRLPTEAEWEYAARAGKDTAWSFGDDEQDLPRYAWFEGNSGGEPHPVGTKDRNPWGLYDMHGNVWEWVEDWYGSYSRGDQKNPKGPTAGPGKVVRGGSFGDPAGFLRSAVRDWDRPESRFVGFGFRCVRGPRRQP